MMPAIVLVLLLLIIVLSIVLGLNFSRPRLLLHHLFLCPFLDHESRNMLHSVVLIYGVIREFEFPDHIRDQLVRIVNYHCLADVQTSA